MKDQNDDQTMDIEEVDMDELEAAIDNRVAWSDAVQLVSEALEEWVEYNNDLYQSATDEEEAESIKRLSEETLKAWQRILQG